MKPLFHGSARQPLDPLPALLFLLLLLPAPGGAGDLGLRSTLDPDPADARVPDSVFATLGEQWEDLGLLHRDEDHPVLKELWVLGRYHGQYHWSEGSAGEDEGYESRRLRFGAQARLFDKLSLHAQMVAGNNLEPLYNGFTELWAMWALTPEVSLAVGQQKHRFTHDRNASSRYINYLERAQLTNMFNADYTPAVTLQGRVEWLNFYTGLFSNATGPDMARSFSEFDSGQSYLAAGYIDIADLTGTDTAFLHASFVHSESNANATNLNRFRNGLSTALIVTEDDHSFIAEVTAGLDNAGSNAIGLNLQPGLFLTDELQFVMRYQVAAADTADGLIAQRRYERPAGLPAGDLYQAGYAGLNFHIARHRMKVMTGIEYATMGGQDVWTASAMFRFYFGPHSGGAFPMNRMLDGHLFEHD
jgi:phosphate-selective porin OprO/OprP